MKAECRQFEGLKLHRNFNFHLDYANSQLLCFFSSQHRIVSLRSLARDMSSPTHPTSLSTELSRSSVRNAFFIIAAAPHGHTLPLILPSFLLFVRDGGARLGAGQGARVGVAQQGGGGGGYDLSNRSPRDSIV
jgi:hypothetical protein